MLEPLRATKRATRLGTSCAGTTTASSRCPQSPCVFEKRSHRYSPARTPNGCQKPIVKFSIVAILSLPLRRWRLACRNRSSVEDLKSWASAKLAASAPKPCLRHPHHLHVSVSFGKARHLGPARSTGRRTAWPPRGLFVAPPLSDVGRSRAYRAGYATLPSAAQRLPCRSRTGRADPSPQPWRQGRRPR